MRAGNVDGPLGPLEPVIRSTESSFLAAIRRYTATVTRKVMLGDATVTEQKTFDADALRCMFEDVTASLQCWIRRDVTITNNEDIRRVFVKFETYVGRYTITGHFSLQFHVLLYYVPDQRVVECQKELSDIIDQAKSGEESLAETSDDIIFQEVRTAGETDISEMDLFERLYQDDSLMERLDARLQGATSKKLQQLTAEKRRRFDELDSLLTETYQTVPILIDDVRLATGEEGCLCTFDVSRGGSGHALGEISDDILADIKTRLLEVQQALEIHGA